MPDDAAKFPDINRVVHEPARLAILAVLSSCRNADFLFLQSATGLSKGNLSVQLTRLEEAGLIQSRREIVHRKTRTIVQITPQGKQELKEYWQTLDWVRTASFAPTT